MKIRVIRIPVRTELIAGQQDMGTSNVFANPVSLESIAPLVSPIQIKNKPVFKIFYFLHTIIIYNNVKFT